MTYKIIIPIDILIEEELKKQENEEEYRPRLHIPVPRKKNPPKKEEKSKKENVIIIQM